MSNTRIGDVVARQFDRTWKTLRQAITNMSDEQWRQSDHDWLTPARLAYHIVETADFYSENTPKDFNWGALGGDWEGSPASELPSQQQILDLLDRVQPKVKNWLADINETEWFEAETEFPWTGKTLLDRALYSMRHAQHHVAQINAELRRRDLPCGEWV